MFYVKKNIKYTLKYKQKYFGSGHSLNNVLMPILKTFQSKA